MKKQLLPFRARASSTFRSQMIAFWVKEENCSPKVAIDAYGGDEFDALCKKVTGKECTFIPDLGYHDKSVDGTICFEKEDNNLCIPVSILIEPMRLDGTKLLSSISDEIRCLKVEIEHAVGHGWFEKAARLHVLREGVIKVQSRINLGDYTIKTG